jgi:hypothetical protein
VSWDNWQYSNAVWFSYSAVNTFWQYEEKGWAYSFNVIAVTLGQERKRAEQRLPGSLLYPATNHNRENRHPPRALARANPAMMASGELPSHLHRRMSE